MQFSLLSVRPVDRLPFAVTVASLAAHRHFPVMDGPNTSGKRSDLTAQYPLKATKIPLEIDLIFRRNAVGLYG